MQATKRADGRWCCSVYIGMIDGKKKYKYCYGATKKEAEAEARRVKAELDTGVDMLTPESFGYWAEAWLKGRRTQTTPNQYDNDRAKVGRVLLWSPAAAQWRDDSSALRYRTIGTLKPYELQSCLDELAILNPSTRKPTSRKTLTDYRNVIRQICAFAHDNRAMSFDPSRNLTVSRQAGKEERRALDRTEQQRIFEFEHRCRLPAVLMMYCGLRRGELSALTWNDVDTVGMTISVNKAYDFKQGTIKPPKTKAGTRTVPIPRKILPLIEQARKQSKTVLVVTGAHGYPMQSTTWRRWLKGYLTDLNLRYGNFTKAPSKYAPSKAPMMIEPFSWHCLRHTYATILYDAGVDVLTAQKLLGHADVKTTMSIYTHLSKEKEELNIEKLNNFLSPDRSLETVAK